MISSFSLKRVYTAQQMRNAQGHWLDARIPQPTTTVVYNENIGDVDSNDQWSAYYDARTHVQSRWQPRLERRARKTSMINSMILVSSGKLENEKVTLLCFIKKVLEQWQGYNNVSKVSNHINDASDFSKDEEYVEEFTRIRKRHIFTLSAMH